METGDIDEVTQRKFGCLTPCRSSCVEKEASGFREDWKVDSAEYVDLGTEFRGGIEDYREPRVSF